MGAQGQAQEDQKTEMEGSSSRSRSHHNSHSHSSHHRHSSQRQHSSSRSSLSSLEMITGSSSIQVETKKGLEEDLLEIGWKMTGNGMGTGMMIERIVAVSGESGEEGALTGTDTETWKTEIDALVGIGTETGIPEIESPVERRKTTEGRNTS